MTRKLGQFPNLRNETGGRDCNATGAYVETPVGGDHVESQAKVGEVGEGFAHAHHDYICNFSGVSSLGTPKELAATQTCPIISSKFRFLEKPCLPVAQKLQSTAHPT